MKSNYWHNCLITWNSASIRSFHFVQHVVKLSSEISSVAG